MQVFFISWHFNRQQLNTSVSLEVGVYKLGNLYNALCTCICIIIVWYLYSDMCCIDYFYMILLSWKLCTEQFTQFIRNFDMNWLPVISHVIVQFVVCPWNSEERSRSATKKTFTSRGIVVCNVTWCRRLRCAIFGITCLPLLLLLIILPLLHFISSFIFILISFLVFIFVH